MCLQAQVIDDNDGGIGGVRREQGLSNNNGGVGGGLGIYDASEVSEMTTEADIMRGQQRRLRRLYDGPEESATTMEASSEEDDPGDSTTTTNASAEEAEETTRLIEHLQQWRRWCVYGPN